MFETTETSGPAGESRGTTDGTTDAGARARPTRRGVLRAVGAGTFAAGFLPTTSTPTAAQDDPAPAERVYRQCERFVVPYSLLPADVQAEVDEAIETGSYESETTPLLAQAMDLESSYLRRDDTYYEGAIEVDGANEALVLAETTPTLDEPERLALTSAADESHSVAVRVEDDAGEVVFEDVVTVEPDGKIELVSEDEYGSYTVLASTEGDDFQAEELEFTWGVNGRGGFAELVVEPDGDVDLQQAVAGVIECEFEIETQPTVRVELADAYVPEDGSTTGRVVLDRSPTGVSAFQIGLSVDGGPFQIETAVGDQFEPASVDAVGDPYPVAVAGELADEGGAPAAEGAVLATFSLEGSDLEYDDVTHSPEFTVSVQIDELLDHDGFTVPAETAADSFRVPSGDPPMIDGCPDITGDGTVGHTDVVRFFQNQHRSAWKDPDRYDFSGNGEVGHGDVVWLWECVATQ